MATHANPPLGRKLKILVVDDDPVVLELLRDILRSQGLEVFPLSQSQPAAELIEREAFDGIFVDQEMAGLTGMELCSRARKSALNRSTPVVMITGCEDRKTMEGAFAAGVTFFLSKPIDRPRLLNLLKTVRGGMLARTAKT